MHEGTVRIYKRYIQKKICQKNTSYRLQQNTQYRTHIPNHIQAAVCRFSPSLYDVRRTNTLLHLNASYITTTKTGHRPSQSRRRCPANSRHPPRPMRSDTRHQVTSPRRDSRPVATPGETGRNRRTATETNASQFRYQTKTESIVNKCKRHHSDIQRCTKL